MSTTWMVRAGRNSRYFTNFIENGLVAIGWTELGDIDPNITKEALTTEIDTKYSESKLGTRRIYTSMVYRFIQENGMYSS